MPLHSSVTRQAASLEKNSNAAGEKAMVYVNSHLNRNTRAQARWKPPLSMFSLVKSNVQGSTVSLPQQPPCTPT